MPNASGFTSGPARSSDEAKPAAKNKQTRFATETPAQQREQPKDDEVTPKTAAVVMDATLKLGAMSEARKKKARAAASCRQETLAFASSTRASRLEENNQDKDVMRKEHDKLQDRMMEMNVNSGKEAVALAANVTKAQVETTKIENDAIDEEYNGLISLLNTAETAKQKKLIGVAAIEYGLIPVPNTRAASSEEGNEDGEEEEQ